MVYPTPYATQRPMPQPPQMAPQAPRAPYGMPQAPTMMPPASQPLIPQNLGLDPAQMAALQGQMTPEVMQQVSQMMQNPQVQAQLQQLEQMAKSGQLTPDMLQQAMGGLPMMPGGGPMPPMPSVLGNDFNPVQWIRNGIIGVGMGMLTGSMLDRFMEGAASNQPSWLDRSLRRLEMIPGVDKLNTWLNQKFQQGQRLPKGTESLWLRMDGHYTSDQVMENLYKSYLGKGGHMSASLQKLKLPTSVMQQIQNNTHGPAQLNRLLHNDLIHFLPEGAQEVAAAEIQGTGLLNSIQSRLSKWLPKGWISPPTPSSVTLRQLDRLVDKEHFAQWIQDAVKTKGLSGHTAEQLLKLVNTAPTAKGVHAGDAFAKSLEKLVNGKSGTLKKLLGLSGTTGPINYSTIQTALKAQTGGRQTIAQSLASAAKGLLSKDFALNENMTLGQAQAHLNKYHLVERLGQKQPQTARQLRSALSGLFKRSSYINTNFRTVMEGEQAIARALEKKGIGPVGRFFGKLGYYMQRTLDGANLRLVKGQAVTGSASNFGRALISLFVFGLAISSFCKNTINDNAPKPVGAPTAEQAKPSNYLRFTRFMETLANGLGGYMGFELGRSFVPQLRLLTRTPGLARFCNKAILGFLPFTYGGFIAEMLIPGLMGVAVGYPIQKLTNLIFGDPAKIAEREQFAADRKHPLNSQRGILEGFAKGEIPKVPGVVPGVEAIGPVPNSLTPQNVGLTPEQIAYSPMAARQAQGSAQLSADLQKHVQSTVWSYGGH